MATTYKIDKVIGTSKKRKGGQQITVNFNGQSITRHIINGMGRHPDDSVPALHKRLEETLEKKRQEVQHKMEAIRILNEKKPKDFQALIVRIQDEVRKLELTIPMAQAALDAVRKADPQMVSYT